MGSAYQIRDQFATYFLTFQVVGWADIFTRKLYKDIIIDSFDYCRKHRALSLFAFVIMSNHVHVIIRSTNGNLSALVGDIKRHTAKKILFEVANNPKESRKGSLNTIFRYHAKFNKRVNNLQFWTHHNHAVELSSNDMMDSRINYIHNNPVKAGIVSKPEHYLYSSARNYAEFDPVIEIDFV